MPLAVVSALESPLGGAEASSAWGGTSSERASGVVLQAAGGFSGSVEAGVADGGMSKHTHTLVLLIIDVLYNILDREPYVISALNLLMSNISKHYTSCWSERH